MKTRDQLAIQVMRAVVEANPDLVKGEDVSPDDGSDVSAVIDIFKEARSQIRDEFEEDYFPDDAGER